MKKTVYISIILVIIFAFSLTAAALDTPATQEISAAQDTSVTQDTAAAQETSVAQDTTAVGVLTLEEALDLAAKNNRQSAIDDLEIIAKETAMNQAREDAEMSGDKSGSEDVINGRIQTEAKAIEAETAFEESKLKKTENAKQLRLDVTQTFYDILLAEKEYEKEKKKLEIFEERLTMAKARYNSQSITFEDLESVQYELDKKAIEVEAIQEKLKSLDLKLKSQMNLPFEGEQLKLDGEIKLESFTETNMNRIVADYLEIDLGVYSAAGRYEAAKRIMEETEKFLRQGSELYDDNKVAFESALRDYEAAKRNSEMDIRNIYNEVLNQRDDVELAVKYEELMLKKLNNAKVKLDKGTLSKDDYMTAEEAYIDAKYSTIKEINDFNMNLNKYTSMLEEN